MIGGGVCALGLVLGCRHTQPEPQGCNTCTQTQATVPATPAPGRLTLVPTAPPLVPATPSLVPQDLPIVTVPSQSVAPVPRAMPSVTSAPVAPKPAQVAVNPEQSAPPPAPVPVIVQKPVLTERGAARAPAPVIVQKPVLTERGATPPPSAWVMPQAKPVTQAPAAALATTDTATAPSYYNSADYSILFGVLDYNARRGTWRLRFADAAEEDRYGGSVTLDGVGRQMRDYVSGQSVRVEGALVDPESRDVSPAYRVKEMRPVTAGK
jgi:hypothetical protein